MSPHPDGPVAPDRLYHRASAFAAATMAGSTPAAVGLSTSGRREPTGPVVLSLPAPLDALDRWRSGERTGPILVGALLGLAAGRRTPLSDAGGEPDDERAHLHRLRTYPSAGGRYPLDVVVPDAGGPLRYDADGHCLRGAPGRTSGEPLAGPVDGVVVEVWAALGYQRDRYGLRSYRFVHLELGHLLANLELTAAALELSVSFDLRAAPPTTHPPEEPDEWLLATATVGPDSSQHPQERPTP